MSAPMPDFEMPEAASERRGRWLRLPRGPRARRILGIGVVAAVLAALAIVGVPALVDQQRGRDAVAVVERYAADVTVGDVDAVVAAQSPDATQASDALLRDDLLTPAAPFAVDDVELLALQGTRAIVRVHHTIGPDDGASIVELVHRGGEWRIAEGLLGIAQVPHGLALALGDEALAGRAWLLPGRYSLEPVTIGVVDLRSNPFVVVPGERVDVFALAWPTMEGSSVAYTAVEAFVAQHRAACGDACSVLGADTGVPPSLEWDLDLASHSGTMTATITTEAPSANAEAMGPITASFVDFDVVLADDLQSLTVTPASPVAAP
ncbi:hypothetical protein [Agrococcus jejuensis]|uniref:DUF4878 domain-containing protein n=1 Tax=Agrococcus jejuensis TaxID=399736 RepID=A0A1G8EWT8_9MICO|nr:hypothetical protein [Agrococcus jejuensis]SDH74277.1 hypothetical protein SAMN04489720_2222 [Agrococcus jejuensis]